MGPQSPRRDWYEALDRLETCGKRAEAARLAARLAELEGVLPWECWRIGTGLSGLACVKKKEPASLKPKLRPMPEQGAASGDHGPEASALYRTTGTCLGWEGPIRRRVRISDDTCWAGLGRYRLLLRLDGPVGVSCGVVPATDRLPERLYVDLGPIRAGRLSSVAKCLGGLVRRVRVGRRGRGLRVVFELSRPVWYQVVPDARGAGLSVDLAAVGRRPRGERPVVVLDPGHGGSKKGAKGPNGLFEKDAALAIARQAGESLEQMGLKVVLTRDGGQDRSLLDRTSIALASGGDVFVSIHLNAEPSGKRQAVETYVLDTSGGALDRRLAERENEFGATKARLAWARAVEQRLGPKSRALARHVHARVLAAVSSLLPETKDGGIRKALFYVLLTARMPAVLAEVSYITNPKVAQLAGRPMFAERVGRALARGIFEYVQQEAQRPKPGILPW